MATPSRAPLPFHQTPIIILGAGIIGCATAHQFLTQGFSVTIVAEHLPSDISPTTKPSIFYASAWAGAAWHAGTNISLEHKQLQTRSYRHLLKVSRPWNSAVSAEGKEEESGVCRVTCREYVDFPVPSGVEGENTAIWGRHVYSSFREIDRSSPGDSFPADFATAWSYDCLVTDPTIHMPYLGRKILSLGGKFGRRKVKAIRDLYDVFPESSVFINASGLGSLNLDDVKDEKCFPERGQNVFYRPPPAEKHKLGTMYFRNGKEYTYIIPRPVSGGLVLGGVKQRGNVSPDIDMDVARDEIARAHRLAPESVPADPNPESLSYIVGIRPSRDGGFRLERERREVDSPSDADKTGSKKRVVHVFHAYGFAGNGYQYSYGVGDELVRWVEEVEKEGISGGAL